jgi:hypothetical protein
MLCTIPRDWVRNVHEWHGEISINCFAFDVGLHCSRDASFANKSSSLVVIEMFNAMNALSSSESLLTLPLWENMVLVYAITLSMVLHFALLYTPFLQTLFSIIPLNWNEWKAVIYISSPVMWVEGANLSLFNFANQKRQPHWWTSQICGETTLPRKICIHKTHQERLGDAT